MSKIKSTVISIFIHYSTLLSFSQTIEDVFNSEVKITSLGIDYAQVKLIGEFSQFYSTNNKNALGAYFHIVVINMSNKKILLWGKMKGELKTLKNSVP